MHCVRQLFGQRMAALGASAVPGIMVHKQVCRLLVSLILAATKALCAAALWSENGCSRSTSSACKRNACTCRRVGCVWMGVIDRLRDKCNVKEAAALWSGNGCSRSISSACKHGARAGL